MNYNSSLFTSLFVSLLLCIVFSFAMQKELTKSFNTECATQDLTYIYQTLMDSHPGIYNELDPEFTTHMQNNFAHAQTQLVSATTDTQRMRAIVTFVKSFCDNHLGTIYNDLKATEQNNKPTNNIAQTGITTIQDKIHWITLPTFAPDTDVQNKLKLIIETIPTLRTNKLIIFDVRGNGGGNSAWGTKIVKSLFGDTYAARLLAQAERHVYSDWRASHGNIEYLKTFRLKFENEFGIDGEPTQWLIKALDGMQQAYLQGNHYYRDYPKVDCLNYPHDSLENMVTARIMIIIDSHCASACLNFIDDLKAMNYPVTLIGKTTNADSLYMDIRTVTLPSDKGTFWFPMKVYRNRPRGHNVPYQPDIQYDGDITDTNKLQNFVLQLFKLTRDEDI